MKSMIIAAAVLSGCINTGSNGTISTTTTSGAKASYLVVGMESSARFGSCPGCELDAKRITSLMATRFGYGGDTVISGSATKETVVRKLREGVERTPEDGLFLFFYSGHGGQEYLGGKEPDGADREDEFLCLYDTYMMDDEIWEIVSKCRGRVFLYFDACHSATMYRSVGSTLGTNRKKAKALSCNGSDLERTKGFTFRPEKFIKAHAMDASSSPASRILCWSGCKEYEYSYGGDRGGALTIAVINNWNVGVSYKKLWESAQRDVNEYQPTQHPVLTKVGSFDESAEAFK